MQTLENLYVDQLKDIYNAEKQLIRALPRMARAATTPELRSAFENHLLQTKTHVERLEQIFKDRGRAPAGKKCEAMTGLIKEGNELLAEKGAAPEVLDAGLIGAAQKIEHYEIATYGTLRTFARTLGDDRAVRLLEETLDEEKQTDEKLTSIAESNVNAEAAHITE